MLIVGLAGRARSGKNTAGAYLERAFNYRQYAMAGPLKEMVRIGLGLNPADFETTEQKEAVIEVYGRSYRHITQTIGTEWGRQLIHPDLWLIIARHRFEAMSRVGTPGVAITDIRFENESEMVRDLGGIVVHIHSKRALVGMSAQAAAHESEKALWIGPLDRVVDNNGTIGELEQQLNDIVISARGLRR